MHLVTIGGSSDKTSIALWSLADFVNESMRDKSQPISRGVQPKAEIQITKFTVNQMRIDPIASHGNEVIIYCGTDNGARNFTLNADTRIVEEKQVPD